MVYKRYIKKGDKIYGPYEYHSKKENGKVVSQYVGKGKEVSSLKKKAVRITFLALAILLVLFFGFLGSFLLTGQIVSFSVDKIYTSGEDLSGSVKLEMDKGELIPLTTKVMVNNSGDVFEFVLGNLIDLEKSEGNYYLRKHNISGFGEGFGFYGEKLVYPEVEFSINILGEGEIVFGGAGLSEEEVALEEEIVKNVTVPESKENVSELEEGVPEEEVTAPEGVPSDESEGKENVTEEIEVSEEEVVEDTLEEVEEVAPEEKEVVENTLEEVAPEGEVEEEEIVEEPVEEVIEEEVAPEEPSPSPITGEVISEIEEVISGSVGYRDTYYYNVSGIENFEVISSKDIDYEVRDGILEITTEYSEIEQGFGEEYYEKSDDFIDLDLSRLNLEAKQGELSIEFIYQNVSFGKFEEFIEVFNNLTLIEEPLEVLEQINETDLNKTVINETIVNETLKIDGTITMINTTQYGAVVGLPVKWKKKIQVDSPVANISIGLPPEAENVLVYKVEENESSTDLNAEILVEEETFVSQISSAITGLVVDVIEEPENVTVEIEEENATEFEIEYETPAPLSFEEKTDTGKEVTISSEFHYQNILAYSELDYPVPVNKIKLYHHVNGSKVPVDFTAYDSEGNILLGTKTEVVLESLVEENKSLLYGQETNLTQNFSIVEVVNATSEIKESPFASFITWVVPHLSNQTYEIVIEITQAEHLDENRNFLQDVYTEVSEKDDIFWTVNNQEYLRVTFEKELASNNDITIWAKSDDGAQIEVYRENSNELLATFANIGVYSVYKIYLTELNGTEDVFDLKIIGGNVEFDFVVDPTYYSDDYSSNTISSYVASGSAWVITSGELKNTHWGEETLYYNTAYSGSIDVSAKVKAANAFSGIAHCYDTSDSSFYTAFIDIEGGGRTRWVQGSIGSLTTGVAPGGQWTDYASGLTYSSGNSYQMMIRQNSSGMYLRVWADGDSEPTTWNGVSTETCSGSKYFGFYSKGSSPSSYYDDFEIASPPDTVDPTITSISNVSVLDNESIGVLFTATDNTAVTSWFVNDTTFAINSTGYFSNNTVLPKTGGNYAVLVTASDAASNNDSEVISVEVNQSDLDSPIFTTIPASSTLEWGNESLNVDFNATDDSSISWSINDTTNFAINSTGGLVNNTALAIGSYAINVSVNDTYGNVNSTVYSVTVEDTIAPVITTIPSSATLEYSIDSLNVDFDATDLALGSWYVNDTTNFAIDGDGTLTNNTILSIGNYAILVSVNDTSGNVNSTVYSVTVEDNAAPVITSPASATLEYLSEELNVDFDATDASSLDTWSINDTTNFAMNSTGGLVNNTLLSVGNYAVNVSINDTYGNLQSEVYSVTVEDTVAPVVKIIYPVDEAAYVSNITSINYTVDSAEDCWYSLDYGETNSSTVNAGENFTINLGTNNLTVYCDDSFNIGQKDISFIVGDFDIGTEINKIQAGDKQVNDFFGYSVSISGDYAIAGSYGEDTGGAMAGAAYIFKKNIAGQFVEIQKIQTSDKDTDDRFGKSVSIFGDYAVVGATQEDTGGSNAGAAYIFKKNATGQFEEVNKIQASDKEANDFFGYSVSISGDYAVIGSYGEDEGGDDYGAAYIFKKNSTGQFEEVNKIQASDREGNDYFGYSVSISGDYAVIGAYKEDTGGDDAGAAYMFKKNATGQFEEINKIQASDKEANDQFGRATSISGDYAVIGAITGASYIFKKNSTGQFTEVNKIPRNVNYVSSISISGDYVIVGNHVEDTGGNDVGAAYIFNLEEDLLAPVISYPASATLEYLSEELNVDFDATDDSSLDTWSVNDTTNFAINSTGGLINNTVLSLGSYAINISVNDTVGNINSTIYSVTIEDTIIPEVSSITSTENSPTNISLIPMRVIFSENVSGFTSGDVTIGNGSVQGGSFSGSGDSYSFNVVPSQDGNVTVDILAGVFTDVAGNPSVVNASQFSIISDRTAPTVEVTYEQNPAAAGNLIITAVFSESLSAAPNISIDQAGSEDISNVVMAPGDGYNYTYNYTIITANGSEYIDGTAAVSITNANDLAGNPASASLGTGGTITKDGLSTIHQFRSSGTFTIPENRTAELLVVGGGGGGGSYNGGGGDGGSVYYSGSYLISNGSYSVTVGAGGLGTYFDGTTGGTSTFSTISRSGGAGGNRGGPPFMQPGSGTCLESSITGSTVSYGCGGNTGHTAEPGAGGNIGSEQGNNGYAGAVIIRYYPFSFTIDTTSPTISNTINTPQILKSGATSTSNVRINEAGSIYLVKSGVSATSQTDIDSAISAKDGFLLTSSAVADQLYTVTVPESSLINEGEYNFVAVDDTGNVPTVSGGWLTIDNTIPEVSSITSTENNPSNATVIPMEVVFSEDVSGFGEGDITVGNGSVQGGSLSGSGDTYTFNVDPSQDGIITVDILAGTFTDLADNANTADADQFSIFSDTSVPVLLAPSAAVIEYIDEILYRDFNVTELNLDSWTVNDTTNFVMNSTTGVLENNTILSIGVYSIFVSVNDTSGNTNSTVYSVTVQDTTSPVIEPAVLIPVEYEVEILNYDYNATDYSTLDTWRVSDTTNFEIDSSTGVLTNKTVLGIQDYIINIYVNDTSGNSDNVQTTIRVRDTIAPVLTLANFSIWDYDLIASQFSAVDRSGISYWAVNDSNFAINNTGYFTNNTVFPKGGGLYTVKISVADNQNNLAEENIIVNVTRSDSVAPIISAPGVATIEFTTDALSVDFGATDANPTDVWTVNNTNFAINSTGGLTNNTVLPVGVYALNIAVNDTYSNVGEKEYSVTVQDTTAPTISAPASATVEFTTEALSEDFDYTDYSAIGNWYVNDTTNFVINPATGILENNTILAVGSYAVLVSVNDTYGNFVNEVYSVIVQDTTAPTISAPASATVEFTTEALSEDFDYTDYSAIGNWFINDTTNFAINGGSGIFTNNTILAVGSYAINVSVNDTYGNLVSEEYSVTVQDTTAPTISAPLAATIEFTTEALSEDFDYTDYSAIGNWFVNDTTNFIINSSTGILENNTVLSVGSYSINVSVNDTYGNLVSEEYSVTVEDTTAPTISAPLAATIEFTSEALNVDFDLTDPSAIGNWFINDTTNFAINSTGGIVNNTILAVGNYAINISVNDTYGNLVSEEYSVTVQDTTAPTITAPLAATIEFTTEALNVDFDYTDYSPIGNLFINDTTNFAINSTGGIVNNTILAVGNYAINISVNDTYNNVESVIYFVTVQDTVNPVITTSGTSTVEYVDEIVSIDFEATDYSELHTWTVNDVTNFIINSSTGILSNNTVLSIGTYPITVGVNDTSGNSDTQAYTVIVQDTTAPIMTLSNFSLFDYEAINYQFDATDHSGIASWTVNDTTNFAINSTGYFRNNTVFPKSGGVYSVLVRAFDNIGNYDEEVIIVTVLKSDNTAPVITPPADPTIEFTDDGLSVDFSAFDTNSLDTWTVNNTNFVIDGDGTLTNNTVLAVGVYPLLISVNDTYSNTGTDEYSVTVVDTTSPTISAPASAILEFTTQALSEDFDYNDHSAIGNWYINDTTNFAINSATGILENNTVFPVGSYAVLISVNDTYGNFVNEVYSVTVVDTTSPTISAPAAVTIEFTTETLSEDFNYTDYSTIGNWYINDTTNFAINSATGILENNTILSVGNYAVLVSVNDTYGNSQSEVYSVTVRETTAPVITAPLAATVEFTTEALSEDFGYTDYSPIGNWFVNDTTNFVINSATGILENNTILSVGNYAINISVNDTYGNLVSEEYSVTVEDTTAPTISAPASATVEFTTEALSEDFNYTDYSAIGNWYINDTTNFAINSTGGLVNNTILAVGIYAINISVNDTYGNLVSEEYSVTVVDTTAPTITINYPLTIQNHLTSVFGTNINVTTFDYSESDICMYELDGAANITMTKSNSTFYTSTFYNAEPQYHNLTVYCNDTEGVWNSNTIQFFVDVLAEVTVTATDEVNTSEPMNVQGSFVGNEGITLSNVDYLILFNDDYYTTNTTDYTNFSSGTHSGTVESSGLRLDLSASSQDSSYSDDFSTTKYTADSYEYSNSGYEASRDVLFSWNTLSNSVGNITYRYISSTNFSSATVNFTTGLSENSGANTSLWYSLDYSTWILLDSTVLEETVSSSVPIDGEQEFYIMFMSDTNSFTNENPLVNFSIDYSDYVYPSTGNYISPAINSELSYVYLTWAADTTGGNVSVAVRESGNGTDWEGWSQEYLTSPVNITQLNENYLQYRITLNRTNLTTTPIVNYVNISMFDQTTNSTGGYNYTFNAPSDNLGNVTIKVIASENSPGVVGEATTYSDIWVATRIDLSSVKNYSSESNYTVLVNFTRTDTNQTVPGLVNVNISNSTYSSTKSCDGTVGCSVSWLVPSELVTGNYTITVDGNNESGFYRNSSTSFVDYLEENLTTGNLTMPSYNISDFSVGQDYTLELNATITNTGQAKMQNISIYDYEPARSNGIQSITQQNSCSTLYPGEICNMTFEIIVDGNADAGEDNPHFISWRATWGDNNGGSTGGESFISYVGMEIIIEGRKTINVSTTSYDLEIEHGQVSSNNFNIQSIGTIPINNVSVDFIEGNTSVTSSTLPSSWINLSNQNISIIYAGNSEQITMNITVPAQQAPDNYTGILNVSSVDGGYQEITMNVVVPTNATWYMQPVENNTYNKSFAINTAGEFANYTFYNLGNVNLTFNVTYTPAGSTDYSAFGTNLIEEDYLALGTYRNPSSFEIEKGSNGVVSLYHKGLSSSILDVGIIAEFSSTGATPSSTIVQDVFEIREQAPNIVGVWITQGGVETTTIEHSLTMQIKYKTTDDVGVNVSTGGINITTPSGVEELVSTPLNSTIGEYEKTGAKFTTLNYSLNYIPSESGAHSFIAWIDDNLEQRATSDVYNFTVYGTNTFELNNSLDSKNITQVDKTHSETFSPNYTFENQGNTTAYDVSINFSVDSRILVDDYSIGNVSSGASSSYSPTVNVTSLTPAGSYNMYATLNWRNPDSTWSSTQDILAITVTANNSFEISPLSSQLNSVYPTLNSTTVEIENTGNAIISGINFTCENTTVCNDFNITFNETSFSIPSNTTKLVNISIQNSNNLIAQNSSTVIRINTSFEEKNFTLNLTVPTNYSWSLSNSTINLTRGLDSSGDVGEVVITNNGNVNYTFTVVEYNSTYVSSNVSSFNVSKGESTAINLNYSAPSLEGDYPTYIGIVPGFSSSAQNITFNLYATSVNVSIISPNSSSPATSVEAGDLISISINATYGASIINSANSWSAIVDSTACTNLSYEFNNSTNLWEMNCTAPSLDDANTYNLTTTIDHTTYGQISDVSENSVTYLDVDTPTLVIVRNNMNISESINLTANITDNLAVDKAWFNLTYPNETYYEGNLILSDGYYRFTNLTMDLSGEYLVNYSANDTTGNLNTTSGWFEVYDNYSWSNTMVYHNSTPARGVVLKFYRPGTTELLLNGTTNSSGQNTFEINKRDYDVEVVLGEDTFLIQELNFTNATENNISLNFYSMEGEPLEGEISLYNPFIGIASNSTGISNNAVTVEFDYEGHSYDVASRLGIVKCGDWNYQNRTCDGSWSALSTARNTDTKKISANSTGSSSYFLAENTCGNGACEISFGETTSTCSSDCQTSSTTIIQSGGGGGGGLGSGDLKKIEDLVKSFLNVAGVKVETDSIYKEMFAGDTSTVRVRLKNTVNNNVEIVLSASGEISDFIFFETSAFTMAPAESREVLIKIMIPQFTEPSNYDGDIVVKSGEEDASIPVSIKVLAPEGKLLDVKIQPLTETVAPGELLRLQTDLLNLGKTERVDVQFDLQLIDIESAEVVARSEEAFAVETSISTVKNITVPTYVPVGSYMVKAVAYYSNVELDGSMQASSIAYIKVQNKFFKRKMFGISMKWISLGVAAIVFLILVYLYFKWLDMRRRRYKVKVDVHKLPRGRKDSIMIGRVAEYGNRAFLELDKLKTHVLVAGQTGSGKTIAAQDMVEGALEKGKGVIVFDPTAQWTGFLRKCEDRKMLSRYSYFDMRVGNSKAFKGSIKVIKDPYELINIDKYMGRAGEITIFDVSNLQPKEIDIVVASTIEQIFNTMPEESEELKTLIVYDEVHRLLPKFGGSGKGFIQIERGAREFRKWGIGLLLISQVLSDFVGEVKANIGTEVQMGTRYEGDLERIDMKYGGDILKSVVKEPTGTGMIVNAEYNSGRPYFVSFRPILHSTQRLSKAELMKYEKYFDIIEDLTFQIEKLKEMGQDVIDLELELKLSRDKMGEGKFQMVDMYLETLEPRVKDAWKKARKKPMHLKKRRLTTREVLQGVKQAKKDRETYIKKNPEGDISFKDEINELNKFLKDKKKSEAKTLVEKKFKDWSQKVKKLKGKMSEGDSATFKEEFDSLKKEVEAL